LTGIEVVHTTGLRKGGLTRGITRKEAFALEWVSVGRSRIPPLVASGWHHHAKRDVYGYLVAGRLRLEYGRGGKDAADVRAGDFFHIPVGLVHRDVNPSRRIDAIVVNVLLGEGPTVVNVAEP